jgi:hypothetical protein
MAGSREAGKTLLACALPSILPRMTLSEARDATREQNSEPNYSFSYYYTIITLISLNYEKYVVNERVGHLASRCPSIKCKRRPYLTETILVLVDFDLLWQGSASEVELSISAQQSFVARRQSIRLCVTRATLGGCGSPTRSQIENCWPYIKEVAGMWRSWYKRFWPAKLSPCPAGCG